MLKSNLLGSVNINAQTFCSIWISNHEGVLKERYRSYLKYPDMVKYMNRDGNVVETQPGMRYEEFAVFMFDHAAFSIEHYSN